MSQWKVSKEKIELSIHPNGDNLEIGKVGTYQVVVQKGLYSSGDEVIFVPEKSILTGDIRSEFEKYLSGSNNDRVKSVRLRGEISCGIIIPNGMIENFDIFEVGNDISNELGISKYEPVVPDILFGILKTFSMPFIGSHDCEHYNVYIKDLIQGERVVISEKVHGSQAILAYNIESNETIITSKGYLKSGFVIEESDSNQYWIAFKNDKIIDKIVANFKSGVIQIFGELIPIQKGYSYGQDNPTIRIFDIRLNGDSIPYDLVPDEFKNLWVPIIYDGILNLDEREIILYEDIQKGIRKTKIEYLLPSNILNLCKGKEMVSGQGLHIREGAVLRPYVDRYAKDGTKLRLKIINPSYKESGEEIN